MDDIDIATERALALNESAIDVMTCKNCRHFSDGICADSHNKTNDDDNCASWDKKLFSEEKDALRSNYERIIKVLKKYCDLNEEYYPLVSLWIIGTYAHKEFVTYPYLFFNAMKGSGKSRLLKLVLHLSNNGKMVNNLSEAVLFRTASQRTLGIDEFEQIQSKEKGSLRELLNSAYKKGTCVERAHKSMQKDGEKWKIEAFDVYCPIIMANISGMEEVLSDRCISMVLEKSNNKRITRLLELFDIDNDIIEIKRTFSVGSAVSVCDSRIKGGGWNDYVVRNDINRHSDTNNITNTIPSTAYPTYTTDTKLNFYQKIDSARIDSRNLELFFPLFVIADSLGQDLLDRAIEIAKEVVKSKKDEDWLENRDVNFINFIANSELYFKTIAEDGFVKERDILGKYREWAEFDEKNREFDWLKSHWIGRALKRLNFIIEKKRIAQGRMVRINFDKAKEKAMIFSNEAIKSESLDDKSEKKISMTQYNITVDKAAIIINKNEHDQITMQPRMG